MEVSIVFRQQPDRFVIDVFSLRGHSACRWSTDAAGCGVTYYFRPVLRWYLACELDDNWLLNDVTHLLDFTTACSSYHIAPYSFYAELVQCMSAKGTNYTSGAKKWRKNGPEQVVLI